MTEDHFQWNKWQYKKGLKKGDSIKTLQNLIMIIMIKKKQKNGLQGVLDWQMILFKSQCLS